MSTGGTLLNISYQTPQYVHGPLITMLDCKMSSSLSPVTPINIQHDTYMGMWEQESVNQSDSKLSEMLMIEANQAHGNNGTHSPTATIHHQTRDCHFPNSQFLTPLPPLTDPYGPSDSQMLDGFHSQGNSEPVFHKLSEGSGPYGETYDHSGFISADFLPHHPQAGSSHSHCLIGMMSQNGSGQCSPGCPCASGLSFPPPFGGESHLASLCQPTSSHPDGDYEWDDLHPTTDYTMFLTKGDSPTTSDSISYTDIDSEMDSKSSGGSLSALTDICHVSPPKRKVGRPPKKDKKLKRNEKKTGRLWEFIRDLLKNPEYCPSLVRWENPEEGHFRFVNSEKVAQLWGAIKGNPRMTYEKLSRAMRYYYKSHVFEPVLGRRLVYKFGYNATNWKPINPNFVTVQKLYNN